MAQIKPDVKISDTRGLRTLLVTWAKVRPGDECEPFDLLAHSCAVKSGAVSGIFAMATCEIQGSLDGDAWGPCSGGIGEPTMFPVNVEVPYLRPVVSGGGSDSALSISLFARNIG